MTLWDVHRDDRDATAIAKAAERSPWRVVSGVLVRSSDGVDGVQAAPKPRAANNSSR